MDRAAAIKELEVKGFPTPEAALLHITELEDHKDTALLRITELETTMEEIKGKCFTRICEVEAQFDELSKQLQHKSDLLAEKTIAEDLAAEKIMAIRLITDQAVDRATLESVFRYPPLSEVPLHAVFRST